jgi:RNA polymerase sigma factor (sigma-70 family)
MSSIKGQWAQKSQNFGAYGCAYGVPSGAEMSYSGAWIERRAAVSRRLVLFETPETVLMARDDAMRLQPMIDALPTSFREALALRDVRGLTYRQIAEVTGVSIGTVRSRLARARNRLVTGMREIE